MCLCAQTYLSKASEGGKWQVAVLGKCTAKAVTCTSQCVLAVEQRWKRASGVVVSGFVLVLVVKEQRAVQQRGGGGPVTIKCLMPES